MSKIGKALKSFLSGDFILTLGLDKYIIHVIYTFILFLLIIWIGLRVERMFIRVEANKKEINELRIEEYRLNYQLEEMSGIEKIRQLLEKEHVEGLKPLDKPAHRIR